MHITPYERDLKKSSDGVSQGWMESKESLPGVPSRTHRCRAIPPSRGCHLGLGNRTPQAARLERGTSISHSSGGWRSQIEAPAGPAPGDDSSWLETAACSLRPHRAEIVMPSSSNQDSNPIVGPLSGPHGTLSPSQGTHFLAPCHWGQGFSERTLRGHRHSARDSRCRKESGF